MESRTALIAGATGLVGGHCLACLLSEDAYTRVRVVTRRTTGITHPKLEEHIVDFERITEAREQLVGDDVFLCLGTTRAKAGSRSRFRQIDYGYALTLATAAQLGGARQLLLVSSVGASPRSSAFYLQVKGELEAALTVLPVRSHHVFRPSMLLGARAERRRREAVGGQLGRAFSFAMVGGLRPYRPIAAVTVARAMVAAALRDEPGQHVYKHDDIVRLAGVGRFRADGLRVGKLRRFPMNRPGLALVAMATLLLACGDDDATTNDNAPPVDGATVDSGPLLQDGGIAPPAPACDPAPGGGSTDVAEPSLLVTLFDRWHESWLASPAVADLDEDGTPEIVIARSGLLLVWHADGTEVWRAEVDGRIWASPVVADLVPGVPGLEVIAAARGFVHAWDADGNVLPGFPVEWNDELRTLAAGDIDGDGALEVVAVTTNPYSANDQRDIIIAWNADGSLVAGFPPNTTSASGCDDRCYVTGGYDQNLALGDVTGNGRLEIFATQDNAYLSLHDGTGYAFDANAIFSHPTKFLGVRFLHDYELAQQGWADDEETANQAHFTNSAPAVADVDGDGTYELVVLGSVQNAAQTDRYRGVALWVIHPDGTRPTDWLAPFHAPDYLAGLWDYEGTNVVAATNQVTVADIDPDRAGPELLFAGFDGRIHCVDARAEAVWSFTYTTDERVLTGGVLAVDLSGDGAPEVVFNSYSPDEGKSHLFVLDGGGNLLHQLPLPMRGAMAVPTVADADGDGTLEIVVNLKDGEDHSRMVQVYTVPGSAPNCLLWPTGRGNLQRNGFVP